MSAALVLLLALGACRGPTADAPAEPTAAAPAGSANPPTAEGVLAACEPYLGMAEVYGVCLVERASRLPTAADVDRVCPRAGTWEAACRGEWVQLHAAAVGFDVAVRACGGDEDCAFQLVDAGFGDDVLVNVGRCEQHLARLERDCVGHALHRWVERSPPDDAEVARVLSAVSPNSAVSVAQEVGMAEVCFRTARCESLPAALAETCRRTREDWRRQASQRCPTRRF